MFEAKKQNPEQVLIAGGETVARVLAEEHGYAITNAVVFVAGDDGIWLQRRSADKRDFPGLWDVTACGAVKAGESAADAARRELFEEMGIECRLEYVTAFANDFADSAGKAYRRVSHVFVGTSSASPTVGEEVAEVAAVPLPGLLDWLGRAPAEFVPPFRAELERAQSMLSRFAPA